MGIEARARVCVCIQYVWDCVLAFVKSVSEKVHIILHMHACVHASRI